MYAPARNNFAVLGVLEVLCRGHFIAQMRKWLWEPRGDQPRDVIPGPSAGGPRGDHPRDVIPGPNAGDSLAAGNIDLPEEVANDELDDLWILRAATHCRQSDEIMTRSISLKVCTLHNPPSLARKCRTVVRPRGPWTRLPP